MTFKKTGLSYVSAILGGLYVLVMLFVWLSSSFSFDFRISGQFLDTPIDYSQLAAAGFIVAVVLMFFLIRFIKKKIYYAKEKKELSVALVRVMSVLSFVVLFAAGIYSLILAGENFITGPALKWTFEDLFARAGFLNANILYKLASSFVYDVFGMTAGVYLIMCLCIFGLACLTVYIGTYAVFGPFGAFFGTLVLFLDAFYNRNLLLEGEALFDFLVASFLFMIFALLLRTRHDGIMVSPANGIIFALLGLCLGGLSSLCPEVIFALIPLTFIIIADIIDFSEVSKEYEEPEKFAVNKALLPVLLTWIFAAIGLVVSVMAVEWVEGRDGINILFEYLNGFTNVGYFAAPVLFPFSYAAVIAVVAALLCLYGFIQGLFTKTDKSTLVFLVMLISACVYCFFGFNEFSGFFFAVLSGVMIAQGIKSFVSGEGLYREDLETYEYVLVEDTEETTEETSEETAVETAEVVPCEAEPENEIETETVCTEEAQIEAEPAPEEKVVVLIDNPLPLPKKHVKKEINYDFEIPENRLHFDYDIKPDDDFDI